MFRSSQDRLSLVAALCTGLTCCAVAAPASARTGGATIPSQIPESAAPAGYGEPGKRSIVVTRTALVGKRLIVRGTLPGAARRLVYLQRLDPKRGWRNVARTRVRSTRRLLVRWRPQRSGPTSLRVVIRRRGGAAATAPVATVNVYRPARATFFGPGLFGRQTFCGQSLTPELLGVAHRRLPCGTLVAILHERREIVVPVVDRGPFHAGYDWDLTQGTADLLDFEGTGDIGYVRVAQ